MVSCCDAIARHPLLVRLFCGAPLLRTFDYRDGSVQSPIVCTQCCLFVIPFCFAFVVGSVLDGLVCCYQGKALVSQSQLDSVRSWLHGPSGSGLGSVVLACPAPLLGSAREGAVTCSSTRHLLHIVLEWQLQVLWID
jgi:hypothetical protein